ncbi:MAG TPA: glutathione S-transferase, partial [Casimicrobiaceae bacterium]|nr:glutathione S-transferase [Casimicrobiaceae bacterium]
MYKLYIGNKNYSSWSLRGWLVTKLSGAPFEEIFAPLGGMQPNPPYFEFSPSGLVPCLHDGDTRIWDTLAIAEYLAERHPGMWPADPKRRAWARSIACEMHSGFSAMRGDMTMCIRERLDVRPWSPAVKQNIERVTAVWNESRARHADSGEFLCGTFSIADCFYGP